MCAPDVPRRRGRPPIPKAAKRPRHAPLPFDAERATWADRVRHGKAPLPMLPPVTADEGAPPSSLRWAIPPPELARIRALLADRREHAVSGLAANSRRTMGSDWLGWIAYCQWASAPVLPALFADVRRFIELLVVAGRRKATVEHHLWTIRQMHRRLGLADPMGAAVASDWWRDLTRERLDGEQHQAGALSLRHVLAMTAALARTDEAIALPRSAPARRPALIALDAQRRRRDAAAINVAYDLMTRPSELASLTWERLAVAADGSGSYRMGRSKTDQGGHGVTLYLRPETVVLVQAWRAVAPPSAFLFTAVHDGPVERADVPLSAAQVGAIFRRAAARAGVESPRFSGHSARVGAALDMVEAGATTDEAQQAGRWADARMVAKYAARPLAARAGKARFKKLARLLDDPPVEPAD